MYALYQLTETIRLSPALLEKNVIEIKKLRALDRYNDKEFGGYVNYMKEN